MLASVESAVRTALPYVPISGYAGNASAFAFHAYEPARLVWFTAHFPVYWGLCLLFMLLGLGRLSPEQERKNKVSRPAVYRRVLEVQLSQLVSYVVVDQLALMPDPAGVPRWFMVLPGLLMFDFVEYVMHRLYHTRLLYARIHKPHHLLWCPYPAAALYNGTIEYTVTGAMIFIAHRLAGFTLQEMVLVNLLGTAKTVLDHTWFGSKEAFHWIHHEINIDKNFEQPWTQVSFASSIVSLSLRLLLLLICAPQDF